MVEILVLVYYYMAVMLMVIYNNTNNTMTMTTTGGYLVLCSSRRLFEMMRECGTNGSFQLPGSKGGCSDARQLGSPQYCTTLKYISPHLFGAKLLGI